MNPRVLSFILSVQLLACAQSGQDQKRSQDRADKAPSAEGIPADNYFFTPQVVYGKDDRLDLYQVQDPALLALADSTVGLFKSQDVVRKPDGSASLTTYSYSSEYGLCQSEPFYEQEVGAFCSGFLVSPDTIVTAGHCVETLASCKSTSFVFGFGVKKQGETPKSVSATEVYFCKELVHSIVEDVDFGVVKLDRPVQGHQALAYRRSGSPQAGDPLLVIGHPAGLPTKVAGGASVRRLETGYLVANLDTYGGNSGSAVFNPQSGLVEGILVRGEMDYVKKGNCYVSNACPDGACRGEDVTLFAEVLPFLEGAPPEPLLFKSDREQKIQDFVEMTSEIPVSSAPKGRKVLVSLDIEHTWRGDLVVKLLLPDGKSFTIQNRTGGSADHLKGRVGFEIPAVDSLDILSQVARSGTWKLVIEDKARWDVGVLKSWSVEFQ